MFQGSPNTQVHYNTKCPSGVIKTQGESANRISTIERTFTRSNVDFLKASIDIEKNNRNMKFSEFIS